MERTIEHLLQQAYLFDDPRAYQAGVRDAVSALAALQVGPGTPYGLEEVSVERDPLVTRRTA